MSSLNSPSSAARTPAQSYLQARLQQSLSESVLSSKRLQSMASSMLLAPAGAPGGFREAEELRRRYENLEVVQLSRARRGLDPGSEFDTPLASPSNRTSNLNSPSKGTHFFPSASLNPYAAHSTAHLIDDVDATTAENDITVSDQDVIQQVWDFRRLSLVKPAAITPPPDHSEEKQEIKLEVESEESDDVFHLISPVRKANLSQTLSGSPFLKMFKLPSFNSEAQIPTTVQRQSTLEASSEALPPLQSVTEAPEISPLPAAADSASPQPPAPTSPPSSSLPEFHDDGSLMREGDVRDAPVVRAIDDPYFATQMAKKASNVSQALRTLAHAPPGVFRDIPIGNEHVHEYLPGEFPKMVGVVTAIHGMADAVLEREKMRKEKEAKELDKRREVAHADYMKLVVRHVRTRLIQEGRYIEDYSAPYISGNGSSSFPASTPTAGGILRPYDGIGVNPALRTTTLAAMAAQSTSLKSLPPIHLLDVHKEVTGVSAAPTPEQGRSRSSTLSGSPQSSPKTEHQSAYSAINSLPALGATATLPARERRFFGPPPSPTPLSFAAQNKLKPPDERMNDMPFHLDPLDPSRPENKGKSYRLNENYTASPWGEVEWPLDSKGPAGDWQALLEEEEVSAYKKLVWLSEIKALGHVPLDGMLELLLSITERAFDVEVILRAGESGNSLFFIKQGEVQLKMARSIVEEMEEKRMLAALGAGSLFADAAIDDAHLPLEHHVHPSVPAGAGATAATTAAAGSTTGTLPLLPTDPDLVHKHVEIAKLGPMSICGEDILIAPRRRYTVISVTPVWLYEIDANALLKCFSAEAKQNFLIAIAHTQRVRERHALVKSRTRLQYHAAPTQFRHFLDEGLKRNLKKIPKRLPHEDGDDGTGGMVALNPNSTWLRGASPEKLLQGGPHALRAVLQDLNNISSASKKYRYTAQSPERINQLVNNAAMIKEKRTLAERNREKERQRSELRGGAKSTAAAAAEGTGSTEPFQPFTPLGRKATMAPGTGSNEESKDSSNLSSNLSSPSKQAWSPGSGQKAFNFNSPNAGGIQLSTSNSSASINTTSPPPALSRSASLYGAVGSPAPANVKLLTHSTLAPKMARGTPLSPIHSTQFSSHFSFPTAGGYTRSVSIGTMLSSVKEAKEREKEQSSHGSFKRKVGINNDESLEARLESTKEEYEVARSAQEDALTGQGLAGEFTRAQLLAHTPAAAAGNRVNVTKIYDERQAFINEMLKAEREKKKKNNNGGAGAGKSQVSSPDAIYRSPSSSSFASLSSSTTTSPPPEEAGDRILPPRPAALQGSGARRVSSFYASPMFSPQSQSGGLHKRRISHMVTGSGASMYDSPFAQAQPRSPEMNPMMPSFGGRASPVMDKRQMLHSTSAPSRGSPLQRQASKSAVTSPITSQQQKPARRKNSPQRPVALNPDQITVPITSSGNNGSKASPFALNFSEGSVFEKSFISGRPGLVTFATAKQHVARHTVAPLRTQHSAMMTLGELEQNNQAYSDLGGPSAPKVHATKIHRSAAHQQQQAQPASSNNLDLSFQAISPPMINQRATSLVSRFGRQSPTVMESEEEETEENEVQ